MFVSHAADGTGLMRLFVIANQRVGGNAPPDDAKQSSAAKRDWIASSQGLLAMTSGRSMHVASAHAGGAPHRPVVASAPTTADWFAPAAQVDTLPPCLGGDAV